MKSKVGNLQIQHKLFKISASVLRGESREIFFPIPNSEVAAHRRQNDIKSLFVVTVF